MTAGFDALAVLARMRAAASRKAAPVSSFSGISRGHGADAAQAEEPISRISSLSSEATALGASVWPEGVDWHLTRDAARLSGLVAHGADWRWCASGALEVVQPNGARWTLLPARAADLLQASLLPAAIEEAAP
jgi:hypothetical protein